MGRELREKRKGRGFPRGVLVRVRRIEDEGEDVDELEG